jgi:hypothetical protein
MGERGLGEVELRRDLLEPDVGRKAVRVQQQHSRGVVGERPVGERVDDSDPHAASVGDIARRAGGPWSKRSDDGLSPLLAIQSLAIYR